MNTRRLSNVVLTYANDFLRDGAGSQLQKIYSIYALSRFLDVSYFHSPISNMAYHGLSSLENNSELSGIIARCNETFPIESDLELPSSGIVHNHPIADLDYLCSLRDEAKESGEFHLVRIMISQLITNRHPEMFYYVKAISPFEAVSSPLFRLAIHVRRGDLFVSESDRMLPNSYYISLALKIIEILNKLEIPFVCELYTEMPSKPLIVMPGQHGIGNRIKAPVIINPKDSFIEEFEVLPNFQKFINTDPVESMKSLATADLLLMSRSSFSYLPAILNKKGIIVYHPFYYSALPEWIDVTQEDSVHDRLVESCERWKADQL